MRYQGVYMEWSEVVYSIITSAYPTAKNSPRRDWS